MDLFEAVAAQDAAALKKLIRQTADVNPFGERDRTPLMLAAQAGFTEGVQLLLAAGADATLQDTTGESAFLKAAGGGHTDAAELLLPFATDDERDLAARMLEAVATDDYPGPEQASVTSAFTRKLAGAGAYVSEKLGDKNPSQRLARLLRSERHRK